jgi:RNA polymerase sigma factor (sigma-70 family)
MSIDTKRSVFDLRVSCNLKLFQIRLSDKLGYTLIDTEEVIQKSLLILWNKWEREPDEAMDAAHFAGWWWSCIANEATNAVRAHRRRVSTIGEFTVHEEILARKFATPGHSSRNPMLDKLELALEGISEADRNLLSSVYVDGHNIDELARKAGKAPRTYYNKLDLLRKKLKEDINRL